MTKEQLIAMLQNKYGDTIDLGLITDEDMEALLSQEPNVDHTIEPTTDPVSEPTIVIDTHIDTMNNIDLDDIDESALDDNGRILLNMLKAEKQARRVEQLQATINSANIDTSYKGLLKNMVELGATKEQIDNHIKMLSESANKTQRMINSGARVFSKQAIKTNINQPANNKVKVGSKEFGASLFKK